MSFTQWDKNTNPEQYQISTGFPLVEFPFYNSNEMPFLHVQVQSVFYGDSEMT